MPISVATRAALAALPTSAKLRLVEEVDAFYRYDPASTTSADGDKIITSINGGRWIKLKAASSSGEVISWRAATGPITAIANQGYIFNPTAGDELITLPANPVLGDAVGVVKTSPTNFGSNRVIVGRNGSLIAGESINRQLCYLSQSAIFQFVGGSVGWRISSSDAVFRQGGTVSTFAAPANINSTQSGIFEFMGKGFNSSGTWSNPVTSGRLRISRYLQDLTSPQSLVVDRNFFSGGSNTSSLLLWSEATSARNLAMLESGFLHFGFRSSDGRISQVRLETIYMSFATDLYGTAMPKWVDVYGSNNSDIPNILNYGQAQNQGETRYNLVDQLIRMGLTKLASFDTSSATGWTTPTASSGHRVKYLQVGATGKFTDIVLLAPRGDINAGASANNPSFNQFCECEFYGDIESIYIP